MADLTNPVDQLSNADLAAWCRARADESGEHPIARMTFRSIATRLERPVLPKADATFLFAAALHVKGKGVFGPDDERTLERIARDLYPDDDPATITPAGEDGG